MVRRDPLGISLNQLQLFAGNLSELRIGIFLCLSRMEFRTLRRSKAGIAKLGKLQNGTFSGTTPGTPKSVISATRRNFLKTLGTLLMVSLTIRLNSESQTD